jgi:dihydrofolate reductase
MKILRAAAASRRVVVTSFVTLDGYTVGPDEDMSWVIDGFDPEMQNDIARAMSEDAELFLFGRVTYEIFAAYWPHAQPYAAGDALRPADGREDPRIIDALNDRTKVVISRTLPEPSWQNTRVVRADLEAAIRALVSEPGGAISVQGSASVVQALQRADLVDEYVLYVHPVLLGSGKPLFAADAGRRDLELAESKRYANGVVALRYVRRERAS